MSDFDVFWQSYPRRQSKGAARTAFDKAIRKTTLETMLAAIADYVRFKPAYQDFKHPSTWLNQECWCDEWDTPQPMRSPPPGKRMNAVEANLSLRTMNHEPAGSRRDFMDVQCLSPDQPGLPSPTDDAGQTSLWNQRSRHH